ncbi:HoxA-like transcriptional regulator [Haloferax mucosum ATCC BAA-1512]|uniref:HoxA-like transcriptional regulator n=1 Tax=Haloferax mucosum ATCC BAA-1512 TaxID=662479 RepID=M0IK12_9EURY|nr:winged helix-turn-helix transcriptional regulator [Haloferax mucosum]ELZ95804.1 HoxA-like transcriptional regulator [Haloferax mucosum ATCC BAA-1512]
MSSTTNSVAASIVAAKWKPHIVSTLADSGALGFGDLKRELESISNKVLANDLDALQEYGIVRRRVLSEDPLRVEYALTESGVALNELQQELTAWDDEYLGNDGATRILVADDDENMADLYATVLDDRYDVVTAGDGREALRMLDETIDLAIVDRRMPGLSGSEVATRRADLGIDCPIIICTSLRPDPSVLTLPIDEYLVKPISPAELREAVASVIARSDLSEREREYRALAARVESVSTNSASYQSATSSAFRDALERLEELGDDLDIDPEEQLVGGEM